MTKRLTLGVDLDSTLWISERLYKEAAIQLYPHIGGYEPHEVTHYDWLEDRYGPDYWEIFNVALHPSWMDRREMYPNAVECLTMLRDEYDVNIHFITYNRQADQVRKPLRRWLTEYFGEGFELSVTAVGKKMPLMTKHGCFGIIDDKVKTLEEVHAAGLFAATLIQPWNREFVLNHPDIVGFTDWYEAEDILIEEVNRQRNPKSAKLIVA